MKLSNQKYVVHFSNSRTNNYDFIRFIAATLVIISHGFILSGFAIKEPMLGLTKGRLILSYLGVNVFFVISGFLITQSFENSKNVIKFIKNRMLRLFPGLVVALLLTTFVLGPIVTSLTLNQYLHHPLTYNYLRVILLHPMQYFLPGVFETNSLKGVVNGSLWTLEFEFSFYILIVILGITKLLKFKKIIILLFISSLILSIYSKSLYPELLKYFSAGMLLYIYREKIPLNKYIALVSLGVLTFSAYFGEFKILYPICGSYLIIYIAYFKKLDFSGFSKLGDLSYGMYIYAFPIQQTVVYYNGGKMSPVKNIIISFVLTFICAVISWHLIEKKVLKLKKVSISDYLLSKFNKPINEETFSTAYTQISATKEDDKK